MRRSRTLSIVPALLLLASCDAPSPPVAPRVPNARPAADLGTTASIDPLRSLVQQLYRDGKDAGDALAYYDAAQKSAGGAAACSPTADLLAMTLDAYRGGRLGGPPGDDKVAANVQRLVVGLNAYCGSVAPASFPVGALSTNGAAAYVRQLGGAVQTIDGLAGISIPEGALSRGVLLTIVRRLTTGPTSTVLGTSLESGPFYDVSTYPYLGKLGRPVSIGLVQVGPWKAARQIDVILGHRGAGGTETLDPQQCTVPQTLVGRFTAAAYLHPGLVFGRVSAVRAASETPVAGDVAALVVRNDSSGTAGGCGSANDLSPFGFVTVYEPGFDARPFLTATYACGNTFAIHNGYRGDLVAVWRIGRKGAGQSTLSSPRTVLVRAGGSVAVSVGDAAAGSELRLQYGPVVLGSAQLPAVQKSCT